MSRKAGQLLLKYIDMNLWAQPGLVHRTIAKTEILMLPSEQMSKARILVEADLKCLFKKCSYGER